MSGYRDPIAKGDGSLIKESVHSPNYVAGVSGWTINKDGSAEFSNVTVRGTVDVGTTSGHILLDSSTDPIESVNRGVIEFQENDNPEFVNQGLIAAGKNGDNEGYLALIPPQYSGDPNSYPANFVILRTAADGQADVTSGYFTGSGAGRASSFVSAPAVMATTGSFVNFTNTEWPWVDITVPPNGILTVRISGEGRNTNTATSNLYFGYEISNANTAVVYLAAEIAFAAKFNSWGNAANAANFNGHDRGVTGSLPPGVTARVKPAWMISSGNAGTVNMGLGRLQVIPGVYAYT